MAINKDLYRALEDVVGADNISDDQLIMPAYYSSEFAAIVLPKNTAEVQAIVRLCNKYKQKIRPICTGWTGKFPNGLLLLDLRRMNHIIEINEKNMYAVVEPYVIGSELQAEVMKRGLNFCVKGAGTNCSAMLRGHGHMDQTTSGDDRNYLAIEWITPEGDIVRTGSQGSVDEWFSGDGPGPSLRALTNELPPGVITKVAMKLYHWPGPASFPVTGKSPRYILSEIPANLMARYYSFPSVEKMWQAELKLGENEITYELMGFNTAMVAANITTCNEEDEKMFNRLSKEVQGPGFFVIIAGNSPEDFAFKKKALQKIILDAGGKSLKTLEDPEIEGILLCQCIRISASIRETYRPGGAFRSVPIMGQRDLTIKWAIGAGKAKEPLIKKGLIVDDGGAFFGWGVEQGQLGKTEIFCKYDPSNPVAAKAVLEWQQTQSDRAVKENYFAVTHAAPEEVIGPCLSNYHIWWGKTVKAIDPNGITPAPGALV